MFLVPAIIATLLIWWAESRFKTGVVNEKWTADEPAATRALLAGAWWKWLNLAEFAVYTWAVSFARHGVTSGAFVYVFILPLGTASRMLADDLTPRFECQSPARLEKLQADPI